MRSSSTQQQQQQQLATAASTSQQQLEEKEAAEFSMGAEVTCFTEVAYRFFVTWLDSKYSRYA